MTIVKRFEKAIKGKEPVNNQKHKPVTYYNGEQSIDGDIVLAFLEQTYDGIIEEIPQVTLSMKLTCDRLVKKMWKEYKISPTDKEDSAFPTLIKKGDIARPPLSFGQRKYLPTFAELVDRLSICMLKKIWIPENSSEYQKEIDLIKQDINMIMEEKDGMQLFNADMIEMAMTIILANRVIWENESKARAGGDEQDKLLKFTHTINGIRNTAKNIISNSFGDRKDLKIDCLAANIPKEFGNWDIFKEYK